MNRHEIIETLSAFPQRLRDATSGLDAAAARKRPPSGDWSVLELVCHLRDYGEIFNSRLLRAVSEDNPRVASYDNDDLWSTREYTAQDLDTVVTAAVRIRANLLQNVARLTEDDWRRTLQHPTWGEPTIEWILNRCAEHELEHLADIAKARAGT